jgi:hypothetical protein
MIQHGHSALAWMGLEVLPDEKDAKAGAPEFSDGRHILFDRRWIEMPPHGHGCALGPVVYTCGERLSFHGNM